MTHQSRTEDNNVGRDAMRQKHTFIIVYVLVNKYILMVILISKRRNNSSKHYVKYLINLGSYLRVCM